MDGDRAPGLGMRSVAAEFAPGLRLVTVKFRRCRREPCLDDRQFLGEALRQSSLVERRVRHGLHQLGQCVRIVIELDVAKSIARRDPSLGREHPPRECRRRPEPPERGEELVMPRYRVKADAMLPATGRERVDQLRIGSLLAVAERRECLTLCARRGTQRNACLIGAETGLAGPGEVVLGIDRAGKVVVKVAPLGHCPQEHAQPQRIVAKPVELRRDRRLAPVLGGAGVRGDPGCGGRGECEGCRHDPPHDPAGSGAEGTASRYRSSQCASSSCTTGAPTR